MHSAPGQNSRIFLQKLWMRYRNSRQVTGVEMRQPVLKWYISIQTESDILRSASMCWMLAVAKPPRCQM